MANQIRKMTVSVDLIVSSYSFKQDDLFLGISILHELKDNSIFKIDFAGPGTRQIAFQFMSMKTGMICILGKLFERSSDLIFQVRSALYRTAEGSFKAGAPDKGVQSFRSFIRSSKLPRLTSPLLNASLASWTSASSSARRFSWMRLLIRLASMA